ncbi:MAG: hypothetical protein GVY36_09980 [Verrucomicrobia bacterium]|jgi:hypothetical protein|nr:hypothetical protein [Verrucomicrobiota bacterium]
MQIPFFIGHTLQLCLIITVMKHAEQSVTNEIDTVLSPIAREMSHRADAILDLREAAARRSDPGRCISCYFKLLAGTRADIKPIATPLRQWLEAHLEVVARDPNLQELERIPIRLETDGIEAYCQQVMEEFRYDRGYQDIPTIELSFQFKEQAETA